LFSLLSLPKTKGRIQTKEPYPLSHPLSLSIRTNNVNLLLKENPKFNNFFFKKKDDGERGSRERQCGDKGASKAGKHPGRLTPAPEPAPEPICFQELGAMACPFICGG